MRIFYQSPVSVNWIRQRPHFIAEGLAAEGHRVFWFYAANFVKCRFRRFDDGNGFCGLELPVLPMASRCRPIEWLNRLWIAWWLRKADADIMVVTNPVALPWLPCRLRNRPTVYDCMDVQTAFFTGRRLRRMRETERWLVRTAAKVIASSEVVRENLVRDYGAEEREIAVIPNGIHLAQDADRAVAEVKHPSAAYFGTIASWFDWEGVCEAARRFPDWTFDLFGPVDGNVPRIPVNVVLHGPVPHESVSPLAKAADILLMPFVRNELIEGVDPVKLYEYLSIGRPIVSSWWPLLEKFRAFPSVYFYGEGRRFADAMDAARSGPRLFEVPVDFLRSNDWASRVMAFDAVLSGAMPEGHGHQNRVDVLLATYRPVPDILSAQVDSIRAQDGVEVNLLCREDESGAGPAANFSALLAQSTADYVALADQDDVWLPAKLSASLAKLQAMELELGRETPLCVFCDSRLVDGELKDLGRTNVEAQGVDVAAGLRFNRLLMQNFIPGHAMIFNAALRRKAGSVPPGAMMHDVWLALVAAAFGRIGYVNEPLVLYRQYERNALGAVSSSRNVAGFRERLAGNERQARAFVERFGAAAPAAARAMSDLSSQNWFVRRFTLVRHRLWKHGWRRNVALLFYA